jgi:hypothetical protein
MSVSELLGCVILMAPEGTLLDWNKTRAEIVQEFSRTATTPDRVALLGLYKLVMDAVGPSPTCTGEAAV